eukprot:COSAG02_NODE_9284_length_2266_cov_46.566682_2_plen_105_part_00
MNSINEAHVVRGSGGDLLQISQWCFQGVHTVPLPVIRYPIGALLIHPRGCAAGRDAVSPIQLTGGGEGRGGGVVDRQRDLPVRSTGVVVFELALAVLCDGGRAL